MVQSMVGAFGLHDPNTPVSAALAVMRERVDPSMDPRILRGAPPSRGLDGLSEVDIEKSILDDALADYY
eukprot:NODE_9622_length_362_cov_43.821086_g8716_i0.p1 GENE.NODE_9622_length_362_cov_43.821086_g8716_i0~~NODE_9622_length_362_cov_43.821086_g8716_i0.p1  ORF type:complete len:80 (-),score=22.41 NODE_9622_length_362_cov_43.821086_g8716_i0:122-328(-)